MAYPEVGWEQGEGEVAFMMMHMIATLEQVPFVQFIFSLHKLHRLVKRCGESMTYRDRLGINDGTSSLQHGAPNTFRGHYHPTIRRLRTIGSLEGHAQPVSKTRWL